MRVFRHYGGAAAAVIAALIVLLLQAFPARAVAIPNPAVDEPASAAKGSETAVLAGGCFWGMQAVFERVKGVTRVTAGYSGGSAATAHYDIVSTGATGHAESVEIVFDPARITYGQILKVFFAVAHDPTELNYQGPDEGTQYRSAIFYASPDQKRIATAYIEQLTKAKAFPRPIVTEVTPLKAFYPAESYHQFFADRHPENMYIVVNDLPKIANLEREFPTLYAAK